MNCLKCKGVMNKKKKIILTVMTILIIIIILFFIPVRREMDYKFSHCKPDITNPETFDYTIYTYKNIYGITINTEYVIGIAIIN